MTIIKPFKGFSKEATTFLKNLRVNNNKTWFLEHKQDYEKFILAPMRSLVVDLGSYMLGIDPDFEVRPAINKTISRIYRDTRFSKNKSPYKTAMWITFKQPRKDWKDAPAYFFEISADSYRYGMGMYGATPATMSNFREMVDKDLKKFKKEIAFYKKQKRFVMGGDKYKRIFDKTKSDEIQDWYQRKNLYFMCSKKNDKVLFSEKLLEELGAGFKILADFYHLLLKVKHG